MKIKNIDSVKAKIASLKKNTQNAHVMAGFIDGTVHEGTNAVPVAVIARKLEEGWQEHRPAETLTTWDGVAINLPDRIQVVPPRAFMSNALDENEQGWRGLFVSTFFSVLDLKKALEIVGQRMESDIKLSIVNFAEPANAPLTIRLKGFNNPLIDTGQMLNDVSYEYVLGEK